MATRGATGGLAGATDNVAVIYDAFGFDIVMIETVGVGQVELDVIDTCDSVTVVLVPESGDSVQTMKAGLMEIADIFCINKSDRPGADRMFADLKHTLDLRKTVEGQWRIPILQTQAYNGVNIDKLFETIGKHIAHRKESGWFDRHRHDQLRKKIINVLKNRFQREFIEQLGDDATLDKLVEEIRGGNRNPFEVADSLYERFARS